MKVHFSQIYRCQCGLCEIMPTNIESQCCLDMPEVVAKLDRMPDDAARPQCITLHPGFQPVCLNVHVLETAYYAYCYNYGPMDGPLNK